MRLQNSCMNYCGGNNYSTPTRQWQDYAETNYYILSISSNVTELNHYVEESAALL